MSIDRFASTPLHRQLAEILRTQIACGAVAAGGDLPAEADIAWTYGVGVDTVRRSLAELAHQGLITIERGRRARVRTAPPREVIPLHVGDVAISRMPTPAESSSLSLATGVPVTEIRRAGMPSPELHPADAIQLLGEVLASDVTDLADIDHRGSGP
ncbi:GntR family transcriptional regulator [Dactylosporangium sp. NPDC051485]|uniref:GntR family transcriptional regulator n=1 Tax=Dactylosporangium sp. NPDC051485 TaxID=3154846 RepID=UPI00341A9F74